MVQHFYRCWCILAEISRIQTLYICPFSHAIFMADANTIYDPVNFDEQEINCLRCGWTGTGSETIIIDLYGIGDAQQVNCPDCDNNLGSLPRTGAPRGIPPDLTSP
jgi:hypothetical protein